MKEVLSVQLANGLARARTRGKKEPAARRRCDSGRSETWRAARPDRDEKAVPGDDRVEAAAERERAHVGFDPGAFGEAPPADGDHGGGRIDAGDGIAALDEMAGDGFAGATTKIKKSARRAGYWRNGVQISTLYQALAAIAREPVREALVEAPDVGHDGSFTRICRCGRAANGWRSWWIVCGLIILAPTRIC